MDAFQDDFPGFSLDEVAGATDYTDFNFENAPTSFTRPYANDWNPLEDPPTQMPPTQIFGGLGNTSVEPTATEETKPPKTITPPPPNSTPTESKVQSAPVTTPNTEKNTMDSDESIDKEPRSARASKSTMAQKNSGNKRRRGDDDEEYNPDAEEAKARKAKKKARSMRSVASPDTDSIPTTPTSTTSNQYQRPKQQSISRGPTSPSEGPVGLKRKRSEEELQFGAQQQGPGGYHMAPGAGPKPPSVGPNGMPLSFSILQKSPPAAMAPGPGQQRPPIEIENVEQRVKELLDENARIIATMGDNLVNASPHGNLDLMVRFRNNIFTLHRYLDYVPGTRTRLPPLPIKVNTFNFIRPDASNYAMMHRGMPNPANFIPSSSVINPTRI